MGELLLWLDDLRVDHLPRVGGKLARLGELRAQGLRVPEGFALTLDAYDAFMSPGQARRELEALLSQPAADWDGMERLAAEARTVIERQPFPAELEDHVCGAYAELGSRSGLGDLLETAVRSSGVSEDGDEASFAGQFDTYLGIKNADNVLDHVRKCWASQFTARALDYRQRRGLPLFTAGIAVGVLQLVKARSAGVVFTLNPINGSRREAVVEGNWGFGESVVSGQVTPDHWLVRKADGAIVEEHINHKAVWSTFDPAAGRVVEREAPAGQTSQACLSHDEVGYIVQLALDIETREGRPQDVEWTVAHDLPFPDNVFLLQHRPETVWSALPEPQPESSAAPATTSSLANRLSNLF